jgi:lipoprotein-releasing system permease protein
MFSAFEWLVAARYLRARRQEGFISIIAWFSLIGIMLGVATLIIVMAVMNGFRHELLSRILGLNGHVTVQGEWNVLSDFDRVARDVAKVPGVVSATPIADAQIMALANNVARGALLRGIRTDDLARRSIVATHIVTGSIDALGPEDVVVGDRLAFRLGLRAGDQITLISPQFAATPFGSVPRMRAYRIAATFNVGMYEYDQTYIFMPLRAAQIFLKLEENQSTGVEVMLESPDKVAKARPALREAAGASTRLHDWQMANASFFNAVKVERNVMFLILTLIILVAAFNVISSMIMLVKDKGRDIAILRTMGASRDSIMRIFFITGASVGVVGTAAGFVLGLAFCANIETIRRWIEGLAGVDLFAAEIRFLSQIPTKVDSFEVALVVIMGLSLSLLATIYPSWRAARLDPVEALRYE